MVTRRKGIWSVIAQRAFAPFSRPAAGRRRRDREADGTARLLHAARKPHTPEGSPIHCQWIKTGAIHGASPAQHDSDARTLTGRRANVPRTTGSRRTRRGRAPRRWPNMTARTATFPVACHTPRTWPATPRRPPDSGTKHLANHRDKSRSSMMISPPWPAPLIMRMPRVAGQTPFVAGSTVATHFGGASSGTARRHERPDDVAWDESRPARSAAHRARWQVTRKIDPHAAAGRPESPDRRKQSRPAHGEPFRKAHRMPPRRHGPGSSLPPFGLRGRVRPDSRLFGRKRLPTGRVAGPAGGSPAHPGPV